jgi:hypothetical protein
MHSWARVMLLRFAMADILGHVLSIRKARARKNTYIILETAEVAPGITLFQIQTVLDMTSE